VSRRFAPVIQRNWANVDAHAVSRACVPVHCNVGSVYALLGWRFYGSPDFVAVVFSCNLSVFLKIRVYRQKTSPIHNPLKRANIRLSAFFNHSYFDPCTEVFSARYFGINAYSTVICMVRYHLPHGMRYATLPERKQFYTKEFNLKKVADWFQERAGIVKYAVIIGRHTRIFPVEYREDADTTIIIDEYKDLADVRNQVIEFLPEAVYYDRNVYDEKDRKTGQELAFDLDPENITCPIHGSLADKMKREQGLSFCKLELEMVKEQAIRLYEHLEKQFSHMKVVYSGRGFHIHVLDPEAFGLNVKKRLEIARAVKKKGFSIDEWVTAGEMRLIRLPYSLHGMVSRIVLPLEKRELEKFDPIHDERCLPKFLSKRSLTSS
jgi:DNA primase catalytic subunit